MPDPTADEAQATPQPAETTPRRTAMAVAQAAEDLATALQGTMDERVLPELTTLRSQVTEGFREAFAVEVANNRSMESVKTQLAAVVTELGKLNDPRALHDEQDAITDKITDQVSRATSGILARLEAAERELAAAQTGIMPPSMDVVDLQTRLADIERQLSIVGTITDMWNGPTVGGVHGKVLELMRRVNAIGKDRTANMGETGGRFKFRGIDEAMDAVGHAMREVGLTLETQVLGSDYAQNPVTNTRKDGESRTVVWTTRMVTMRYTFVDPVDGSRHTFEMSGEGRDASDKATSKAGSMALKYGLLQALMVPVTGMDDGDAESPQVTQERPPSPGRQQDDPAGPATHSRPPSTPPAATDQASRQDRARNALLALRSIDRVEPAKRHAELARIRGKIESEGLGNAEVEGSTLRAWGASVFQTLPADPAEQAGHEGTF